MPRPVFVVILEKPNSESRKRLEEAYHDLYTLNDTVSLVRAPGLSQAVAVTAGIKGKDRFVNGVVFKLKPAYSGYTSPTLWDWLARGKDAE